MNYLPCYLKHEKEIRRQTYDFKLFHVETFWLKYQPTNNPKNKTKNKKCFRFYLIWCCSLLGLGHDLDMINCLLIIFPGCIQHKVCRPADKALYWKFVYPPAADGLTTLHGWQGWLEDYCNPIWTSVLNDAVQMQH